jgi:hypothetical protein
MAGTNVNILKVLRRKFCRLDIFFSKYCVCEKTDQNMGVQEKTSYFAEKLLKIAEIIDHYIDPRS